MMKKYIPKDIEPKWQKKWREEGLYKTDLTVFEAKNSKQSTSLSASKGKYYVLVELLYMLKSIL